MIRSYWEPHRRYGADQVLQAWLRDDRCSGEAWEWILDQRYNLERYDKLRARVLARNLDYVFDKLNQGNLEPYPRRYLLRLLETGVGDFEINEDAAWAALQRLDRWPKVAEAALWRGVLRSARMGFTLRRDSYEIPFKLWQEINKDETCKSIINEKST